MVSHRESGTGFYYNPAEANITCSGATDSRYILAAEIGKKLDDDERAQVLKLGKEHAELVQKELDEMHPAARAARLKEYSQHPDRNPPSAEDKAEWNMYEVKPLNMIKAGDAIEFVSPDVVSTKVKPEEWQLVDPENGTLKEWVCDGHNSVIYTKTPLQEGTLIRIEDPEYEEGKIRDSGR